MKTTELPRAIYAKETDGDTVAIELLGANEGTPAVWINQEIGFAAEVVPETAIGMIFQSLPFLNQEDRESLEALAYDLIEKLGQIAEEEGE